MNSDANKPAASRLLDGHCGEKQDPLERRAAQHAAHLPSVTPWLLRAFSAYSGWYVARHIHAIRISRTGSIPNVGGLPLVIYVNHAAWWDPLICLTLQNAFFGNRQAYAPIDSQALKKYRFFSKLGFFPVDQHSRLGASQFIRTAEAVLSRPESILWLTPQGRFADVRERPVRFKPGLGHLPPRIPRAAFVPLAIEYTHWEERKPEVLCRFGPIEIAGGTTSTGAMKGYDWSHHFEQQLQFTQDALAVEAKNRVAGSFDFLMRSGSGVGFLYDTYQALRAAFSGQTFQREHGNL
jgi:1-acyl-sn-glycerol-3-phosphate acyltransferase